MVPWFVWGVWLAAAPMQALPLSSPPSPCAPCIAALENPGPSAGTAVTVAWALGGMAAGFLTHEAGHVLANWAYDNRPDFIGITAGGFIPFFAISPDIDCNANGCIDRSGARFGGGRRGKYLISTAGFLVGDVSSEVILTMSPCLRYERAPFRTGWLAFNVLLAVGYSLASATGWEVSNGDARGASAAAGWNRGLFAAMLVAPALLDAYRFWWPGATWAPWASRAGKAAMVGVAFSF